MTLLFAVLPFMATTSTSSGEYSTTNSSCRSDWFLNREGCCIKTAERKGRGVYGEQSHLNLRTKFKEKWLLAASRVIPPQTVIEVSPVLLFTRTEYEDYGRHTILDHYTFKWQDGRMALALGLGEIYSVHHHRLLNGDTLVLPRLSFQSFELSKCDIRDRSC
jgi:tRNA-specific adenosine deaminase 3